MRIGQIVASTEPRHGGPSVSVPKLSGALARQGHNLILMSTDDEGAEPTTEGRLSQLHFRRQWPEALCIAPSMHRFLKRSAFDVVHSNGLWLRTLHYAHSACSASSTPHVIAPRGMMSPWAMNFRRWKKNIARHLVHPGALEGAAGFHATSQSEADDIRGLGFRQPICVAPNGIDVPTPESESAARKYWQQACPEAFDRPTALFYSRFHRKKRILELIDLWIAEAPKDWLLLMVGFPQEYEVAQLNHYILQNGGSNQITVFDGSDAPHPYVAASLFLLPSFSESFGMVVAEALASGLPVLVTDTTPWKSLNATDYGWCGPWDEYRGALRDSLALGQQALRERGEAARKWAVEQFSWDKTAATLADFYAGLR